MKNLFNSIMLLGSLPLFASDHPWDRNPWDSDDKLSKPSKNSHSCSDIGKYTSFPKTGSADELQNLDEDDEDFTFNASPDKLIKSHDQTLRSVSFLRFKYNVKRREVINLLSSLDETEEKIKQAIQFPISRKKEDVTAKREERLATLKLTKKLMPNSKNIIQDQQAMIDQLMVIVNRNYPEKK